MKTIRFPPVSTRVAALIRDPLRFKDARRSVHSVARSRRMVEKRTKAVLLLQRVWRGVFCFRTSQRVVREFMALGLSSEFARNASDYDVVSKLMDPRLLPATRACLRSVHLYVGFLGVLPADLNMLAIVGVKPFMASFRFAFHRDTAFEHPEGPTETALFESALPLVEAFERILRLVVECGGSAGAIRFADCHRFGTLFLEYLKRFHDWRVADGPNRIERVKSSLVMLHAGMALGPLHADNRARIQAEIGSLRYRLLKLAGEEELRAIDAECSTRPEFRDTMTRDQLAHELLLDPTFRLDTQFRKGAVRTPLTRGFWEQRRDELQQSPPSYESVFALFEEMRLRLLRMGGFGVYEAIDSSSIRAPDSALRWDGCVALVASATAILLRLRPDEAVCVRAAETEAAMRAAQPEQYARELVAALRFLFDAIMELEDSAPRLTFAPSVVEQGVECERERFDSQLADGTLTLERTAQWMRSAMRKEVETQAVRLLALVECTEDAYIRVHSAAMVGLVVDAVDPITRRECPETLLLDVDRLEHLRQEYRQVVAALTLSVMATRFLTETGNPMVDRPVILQIQAYLTDARPLDNPRATVDEIKAMLLRSSLKDDERDLCVRTVFASLGSEESMHALMAHRTRDIWLRVLMGESAKPTTAATCTSLVARIERAAEALLAVAKLNRTVHVLHYREMLVELGRAMFSSSSVSSPLHASASRNRVKA